MTFDPLKQIQDAVIDQRYALSEHAYDEMDEDDLDALDAEAAILTGEIEQVFEQRFSGCALRSSWESL